MGLTEAAGDFRKLRDSPASRHGLIKHYVGPFYLFQILFFFNSKIRLFFF